MLKVLFVCNGNLFRSQMAEAFFNLYSRSDAAISAGVTPRERGFEGEWLEDACPVTVELMEEKGIDLSKQMAKQLVRGSVDAFVRIVVFMGDGVRFPEHLKDDPRTRVWKVPDLKSSPAYDPSLPMNGSGLTRKRIGEVNYAFLRCSRDVVEEKVRELVAELERTGRQTGRGRGTDDI